MIYVRISPSKFYNPFVQFLRNLSVSSEPKSVDIYNLHFLTCAVFKVVTNELAGWTRDKATRTWDRIVPATNSLANMTYENIGLRCFSSFCLTVNFIEFLLWLFRFVIFNLDLVLLKSRFLNRIKLQELELMATVHAPNAKKIRIETVQNSSVYKLSPCYIPVLLWFFLALDDGIQFGRCLLLSSLVNASVSLFIDTEKYTVIEKRVFHLQRDSRRFPVHY